MATVPLPTDSPSPTAEVVARLLAEQAPHLAVGPVRAATTQGSSNHVFRVGERHAVRVPRSDEYVADLEAEARWLPHLAPHLPTPVPAVLFHGKPSALLDRPWTVVSWLPGEPPGDLDGDAQLRLAADLGRFVRELHRVDTLGLPAGPPHWGYRTGEPVTATIDGWLEEAADGLQDVFDPVAVREAWRRLRDVPPATQRPCWVHTDLAAENLLVGPDGSLAGVLDFGGLGVGDPSADLLYAWSLVDAPAREVLRREAGADEATWLRARAWAFVGPGLLTVLGYRDTMPTRTARLVRMVEAVAAEVGVALR